MEALAVALAFKGVADLAASDPIFLGDRGRRVLDLLTFLSPLDLVETVPFSVTLSRVLLLMGLVLLAAAVALRLMRRRLLLLAASGHRDHIVVCGDEPCLGPFVQDLVRGGDKVHVLHRLQETAAWFDSSSVICLQGDVASSLFLQKASVPRARAAVVLGGSDGRNLADVASITSLCERERQPEGRPLRCIVEVRDRTIRDGVAAMRPIVSVRRAELTLFSPLRTTTRLLFLEHPLVVGNTTREPRVNVLIVGATPMAEEILREVLQSGALDDRGPTIVWTDPVARARAKVLLDRSPYLDQICTLECRELDESAARASFASVLSEAAQEPFTAIFVCTETAKRTLDLLGALDAGARDAAVALPRIFVHAREHASFIENDAWHHDLSLIPFGEDRVLYTREYLLGERLDTLARRYTTPTWRKLEGKEMTIPRGDPPISRGPNCRRPTARPAGARPIMWR